VDSKCALILILLTGLSQSIYAVSSNFRIPPPTGIAFVLENGAADKISHVKGFDG
jgi:hypothetical protein